MSIWSRFSSRFRWSFVVVGLLLLFCLGASGLVLVGRDVVEERPAISVVLEQRRLELEKRREERRKRLAEMGRLREKEREESKRRMREGFAREEAERRKKIEEYKKRPKPKPRVVRRWKWKSPQERVAQVWNVPKKESRDAEIEGLLRICTSEQEGSVEDCIGVYQVLNNIRSRSCRRGYIQLITECDENGETLLSTMRRASRYVVGVAPARYTRQQWISEMTTACTMPESFPRTLKRYCKRKNLKTCAQEIWNRNHKHHCENTSKLVTGLIDGTEKRRITSARIVAWGGRCEEPRGACDDPIACHRGLARVPHVERMKARSKGGKRPANAFWCFRGSISCRSTVDPICVAMGYKDDSPEKGKVSIVDEVAQAIEEQDALESAKMADEEVSLQGG